MKRIISLTILAAMQLVCIAQEARQPADGQ